MVLYEVSLSVESAIESQYRDWLLGHIAEMESFPGFGPTSLWKLEQDDPSKIEWVVAYTVDTRANLEHYLIHHAPRMRMEGMERFGDQFSASRRIGVLDTGTP